MIVSNLQEAFFKTNKLVADSPVSETPSEDSVEGSNFNILHDENLIESFSQISPSQKVQGMATV